MGVEYPRTSPTRLLGRPLALGLDRFAVGYFTPVDPQAERRGCAPTPTRYTCLLLLRG
jgi:hypothetical protein